jgi:Tol biopolymer transport system component
MSQAERPQRSRGKQVLSGLGMLAFACLVLVITGRALLFFMFDHWRGSQDKWDPVWSPDGDRIAFVSWYDGDQNIYLMNTDGSSVTQLTSDPFRYFYIFRDADDKHPAWSPDGKRIAFVSGRNASIFSPQAWSDIYVMDANGRNVVRLTGKDKNLKPDTLYGYYQPTWSPDGKRIAFMNKGWISVMNSDGSSPTKVIHLNFYYPPYASFSWSPDGEYIAFRDNVNPDSSIFTAGADGSDKKQVLRNFIIWAGPAWSPDGKKIAFVGHDMSKCSDCNAGIYVIHPDGTNLVKLATYPSEAFNGRGHQIRWSPDGEHMLLSDGSTIYSMNADGSNLKYLASWQ